MEAPCMEASPEHLQGGGERSVARVPYPGYEISLAVAPVLNAPRERERQRGSYVEPATPGSFLRQR